MSINASDIYNRTAFLFTPVTFSALCSDLANYPISLGVRFGSGAGGLRTSGRGKLSGRFPTSVPEWVERVRSDPNAAPIMKSYAEALERYGTGEIKYVKLLDGGLVDNLGLSGITITRLANKTAYGPLEPAEAVKLRRLLFWWWTLAGRRLALGYKVLPAPLAWSSSVQPRTPQPNPAR